MKKIFIFICLLLSISVLHSQDKNKIPVDPITIANSSFNYYTKTKFVAEEQEYEVTNAEWKTSFMFGQNIFKKKVYLLAGLEHHRFSHRRHMNEGDLVENYRSYVFNGGMIFLLPNKWRIVPFYTGRIASDFTNKDNDKYFYASSIFVEKKHSDHFKYGLGIYNRNGFDAGQWLPIVKLIYQHENWVANILIPSWAGIHYDFNKNTRLGARATFNSSIFNTDSYELSNTLSYTTTTIGLQLRQRLINNIFLFAETGTTYKPQAEFINTNTKNFVGPFGDNHLYFSVGAQLLKF